MSWAGTVRNIVPIIPGSNLICHTHYCTLFYQKCILQHPTWLLLHFETTWRPTTPTFQRQAYTHATATANSPHPCIYRHNSYCQLTTSLHIDTTATANSPLACICSHASLNDKDTFWEMFRYTISSLCECYRVYLHKPRQYSLLHTSAKWYSLMLLGYKHVQLVTVLNTAGNCNTMASIIILYYNIRVLWDHHCICGPLLIETSLCGAWMYRHNSYCQITTSLHIDTTATVNSPHPCRWRLAVYWHPCLAITFLDPSQDWTGLLSSPQYSGTKKIAASSHRTLWRGSETTINATETQTKEH